MQIEFLETGSRDCPLIRLYEVEPKYFSSLHDEILQLATDTRKSCPVHKIPGFQARSDCRLTMFSSSKDEGVQRVGQRLDFEWRLRPAQWFIVAGLVEPFGSADGRW